MTLPVPQFLAVGRPHPFQWKPTAAWLPVGASLDDAVTAVGVRREDRPGCSVYLGQRRMNPAAWRLIRPKAGTQVRVVVVPEGGNGFLRTAAFLALAVGAAFLAPYLIPAAMVGTAGGAALAAGITGGITVVGGLLINALIPVAQQSMGSLSSNPASTYSISGARNRADPWGPVPAVLGRHRVYGRLGAATYTEVEGDDQYLRILIVWGFGPVQLTGLRIGETPIDRFEGVEVEHSLNGDNTDLTLYPGVVFEDATAVPLEEGAERTIRTTEADTDEVSIDIRFPQGLYSLGRKTGDKNSCGVRLIIERRVAGSGDAWTVIAPEFEIRATETTPFRRGYRYKMPSRGQYEIAVRMTTNQSGGGIEFQECELAAIRSIRNEDPIRMAGVAKTAIRIRASDQLYDEVDEINADIQLLCPDWTGSAWGSEAVATRNPASAFRWALTGPANPRPVAEAEIDDDALGAWHDLCAELDWRCDLVVDTPSSVYDTLQTIAATGWATPDFIDGKWTVIVDKPQDTVRQWFTPRNMVRGSFSGAIAYPVLPHAFRCRYVSSAKRYEQEEYLAYADGYTAENATEFEGLELPGVTNRKQVAMLARRHIVQATLRREAISFQTDLDGLVVQRGDLIGLAHDVMLVGTGTGRVREARVSSGFVPVIELDAEVEIQGEGYVVRFAHLDGTTSLHSLAESYGDTRELTLVDAIPEDEAPPVGSLAMVGPSERETSRWLVKAIQPLSALRAELTCVPEAPGIYTFTTADDVDDPVITGQDDLVPAFADIESGGKALLRSTDGSFRPRIVITFRRDAIRPLRKANSIEVQYRRADTLTWRSAGFTNDALQVAIADVQQGLVYEVRARFRFATGGVGLWAGPVEHTVVGVTDPPPDVLWARVEGEDRIIWRYPDPPVDHRGYMVRWGSQALSSWEEAKPAHDGVIRVTEFPQSRLPNHARCVLIKAVDAAGNLSLNAMRAAIVSLREEPWRVLFQTDLADDDYPGTLSKAFRIPATGDEPAQLAAISTSAFRTGNEKSFVEEGAAAFVTEIRASYVYEARLTIPADVVDGDLMRVFVDADDEADYELKYRASDASVVRRPFADGRYFVTGFGWVSGVDTHFAPFPAVIKAPPAGARLVLRFTGTATLSRILVKVYARPLVNRIEDLFVPAAGVKVPLNSTFRKVATVNVSITGESNLMRSVKVTKKADLQNGPVVQGYNQAGAATAGTVDVLVEGD